MPSGSIIFLNGTSSSGKTTLAYALQERFEIPFNHIALDQFRDGLPNKFRGLNAPVGSTGERGLNVVPETSCQPPYTRVAFGTEGKKMLRGMRRAMAAMVETGNNIIIDDIILETEFLTDYLEVFAKFDVYFVGVKCPRAVINEREQARPGRFPGTAVGHFDICHAHDCYDVEVDTSVSTPMLCAEKIVQHMSANSPAAFESLRQRHAPQLQTQH